jgi:uncharacterized protein YbjQ (UPF0145 family)
VTTTTDIDKRNVSRYVGLVAGEAILEANVFRDLIAVLRELVGGHTVGYERHLGQAGETAVEEMGLYRHSRRGLTP